MGDELRYVLAPLRQRRKMHLHDIEPVEEVFAEPPPGYFFRKHARGRRNDPHVDLHHPLATDAREALVGKDAQDLPLGRRSEEHTSELQSLMRISYAVFCLKKKKKKTNKTTTIQQLNKIN